MHNVIFNKELFYLSKKELDTILVAEATALAELLYKPRDILDRGKVIELPTSKQDLLLNLSTKQ
jgi:hypothetical protein